jgi:hypothetical protein
MRRRSRGTVIRSGPLAILLLSTFDEVTVVFSDELTPASTSHVSPCVALFGNRFGFPIPTISPPYVERNNLTMRMSMRRFTWLTNGFSKKAETYGGLAAHPTRGESCSGLGRTWRPGRPPALTPAALVC